MNWDELSVALLELVGQQVTVDVVAAGRPIPIAGLQGILVNVPEGYDEREPNEQVSMWLRVRSNGSSDTSYVHVMRSAFRGADWTVIQENRTLEIRWHNFVAWCLQEVSK